MAENSKIEWTDHTFNPWMGCTKVSPACKNCYAERDFDHRYGKVQWGPSGTRVLTTDANWKKPLKWDREAKEAGQRKRVFCASLADVFEDWQGAILGSSGARKAVWPDGSIVLGDCSESYGPPHIPGGVRSHWMTMNDVRYRLFKLIDATPNLDWLLLTKRPENALQMWVGEIRKNVWLGTSVENQEWADRRLPHLHQAKRSGLVATTFISAEPLVGSIMLQGDLGGKTYNHLGHGGIDWVITGGESGPDARPADPAWFQSLRDQCQSAGVPFHFKQWGEFDSKQVRVGKKHAGRLLDGITHDGLPVGN